VIDNLVLPAKDTFAFASFIEASGDRDGRDLQIGSVGGGNHFVEIQAVEEIHDGGTAHAWGFLFSSKVLRAAVPASRNMRVNCRPSAVPARARRNAERSIRGLSRANIARNSSIASGARRLAASNPRSRRPFLAAR
jgi:hypothetical protein